MKKIDGKHFFTHVAHPWLKRIVVHGLNLCIVTVYLLLTLFSKENKNIVKYTAWIIK